ncbi:MAG: sirohydrochlorin cobaltochelatase [Oscillospiraceae bacterium]|nr:sirohydrochlorin cobaltochelatase [Oscillospiraceae bacterium]
MSKKALLVISFGTFFEGSRKKTIEAIEEDLRSAFPDRSFYRAWTSRILISRMREECGISIDTVAEAMEHMSADGITDVLIQPTLLLEGLEYEKKILSSVKAAADKFESIRMGRSLLATEEDRRQVAALLPTLFPQLREGDALVFMGHGTPGEVRSSVNACYDDLNRFFVENGRDTITIGLVEADPGPEEICDMLKAKNPKEVYLSPLMIVAGDHANNDMAGDEEDSWRNIFQRKGFEVSCIMKGIGEYPAIRKVFVEHAEQADTI